MRKYTLVIAALAVLAIVVAATILFSGSAWATANADEPTPFDMETDNDENGIPDDFENAFDEIELLDRSAQRSPSAAGDRQETILQAIDEFAKRVPLDPRTLRLQAQINDYHAIMMMDITDQRRRDLAEKVQRLEQRIQDTDPVYVASSKYLHALTWGEPP